MMNKKLRYSKPILDDIPKLKLEEMKD